MYKENFVPVSLPKEPNDKPLIKQGLTLVHPFYNDESRLQLQLDNWRSFSKEIKDSLRVLLVDDCSEKPLEVTPSIEKRNDFSLSVYRVLDDLKWHTPGALNLGVCQAKTEWVLIMDSDCQLKFDAMELLMTGLTPDPRFTYWFPRVRITSDSQKVKNTRFLPCSILFNKALFYSIGGFDEDFTGSRSGGYGFFDNDFSARVHDYGYYRCLLENVVATEYMEDIVGPNVQQKTGVRREQLDINKRIWYKKIEGELPRNRAQLQFNWKKVY